MRLLVLGGTVFVGRHIVETAVARGHVVTLFNRGRHGADLFPTLEKLRGDRDGDLSALEGGQWDAVIDTCGNLPRVVRGSAERLAPTTGHYTFVSTVAVYRDFPWRGGLDESAATAMLPADAPEVLNETMLGALKAECERVVERAFAGRALVIRPGFIVGPHDPTGRFTYWPLRIAQGGEVLAPGNPDGPAQIIDVRDLAAWIVMSVERKLTGTFNVTGREYVLTMSELLDLCRRECGPCAFTWLDDEFLVAHGVVRRDFPLWAPNSVGAATIDTTKARGEGLWCQDVRATVHDTVVWATGSGAGPRPRHWLSTERERDLLDAWNASQRPLAVLR
jgi:2'-hydroxyisoflavone reductase